MTGTQAHEKYTTLEHPFQVLASTSFRVEVIPWVRVEQDKEVAMAELARLAGMLFDFVKASIEAVAGFLHFLGLALGLDASEEFWRGVLVTGLVGWFVFRLQVWGGKARSPFKPQTVVQKTGKTPVQVLGDGCTGAALWLLLLIVVLLLVWGFAVTTRG